MELKQSLLNDYPQQTRTYRQKCVHFVLGIVTTLFCLLPITSMAEENTCTGLKKVNNLDELLYQIYTNLDSDCLFTMPLNELEKVWGTKILDRNNLEPGQRYFEVWGSVDFKGRPYHSEADAFYVEARREGSRTTKFIIVITEAYYQANATLFPEGNYPKLLPEPVKMLRNPPIHYDVRRGDNESPVVSPRRPQNPGKYNGEYIYFWLNTNHTHMIYISAGPAGSITRIEVYDEIWADFLDDVAEQKH